MSKLKEILKYTEIITKYTELLKWYYIYLSRS